MSSQASGLGKPTRNGGTIVHLKNAPDKPVYRPDPVKKRPPLEPDLLHRVYHDIFSRMRLLRLHRAHLIKDRQFNETWIKWRGYKSIPDEEPERRDIIERMENLWPTETIDRVPGISQGYRRKLLGRPGILLPVEGPDRKLRGAQIRDLKPDANPKYTWLSSRHASSGSPLHVVIPPKINQSGVFLTEGPLKADYISFRIGVACIASAGVGNWSDTLEDDLQYVFSKTGQGKVIIANDVADYGCNAYGQMNPVSAATEKLATRVLKHNPMIAIWDPRYKGLDDFLQVKEESFSLMSVIGWKSKLYGVGK